MDAGGRFTTAAANGIVCAAMNELRELRRPVGLGQREFAALLSIPLETYGPWDSGRRVVSVAVLQRARDAVDHHQRQQELLPLDRLGGPGPAHLRRGQSRHLSVGVEEENAVASPLAECSATRAWGPEGPLPDDRSGSPTKSHHLWRQMPWTVTVTHIPPPATGLAICSGRHGVG
jgi:hypothetical protein